MRKFFVILALLLVVGSAYAAGIPTAIDPQSQYEKWTQMVYYNSATACSEGDILVWDIDASTGDNDMYVTTTTTANTGPVAGVADTAIVAYSVGPIVIRGLKTVNTNIPSLGGPGTAIGTTTVAGKAGPTANAALAPGTVLGVTVDNGSTSNTVPVYVNPQ